MADRAFPYACVQSLICWFIHLNTYLCEHLLSAGLFSRCWGFGSETNRNSCPPGTHIHVMQGERTETEQVGELQSVPREQELRR